MANDDLRIDMVDEVKLEQQQRARPARTPRVHSVNKRASTDGSAQAAAADAATGQTDLPPDAVLAAGADAPKKRRRRRRPTGRSAGDAPAQDPQV
jgi:poly(A) polymerase